MTKITGVWLDESTEFTPEAWGRLKAIAQPVILGTDTARHQDAPPNLTEAEAERISTAQQSLYLRLHSQRLCTPHSCPYCQARIGRRK